MKVKHPIYGEGETLKSRLNNYEFLIQFKKGFQFWVKKEELNFYGELPHIEKRKVVALKKNDEKFINRRIIEALRLGIVSGDLIDRFTFGRDKEICFFKEWLDDQENLILLYGNYGTGKTHLLNYFKHIALNNEYVVSVIDLDNKETSFYSPFSLYKSAAMNLQFKANNKMLGFRAFLTRAIQHGAFRDHPYFKYFISSVPISDNLWDWIEGKYNSSRPIEQEIFDNDFIPLYTNRMSSNIYCNLLSAIGSAAKNYLNLKGFIIIFDESEVMDFANYNYQILKGKKVIDALIRTAENEPMLVNIPNDGLGLEYCPYSRGSQIPFIYKKPSNLKLIFSLTSNPKISGIRQFTNDNYIIKLNSMDKKSREKILKKILEIYNIAYSLKIKDNSYKLPEEEINIRKTIKRFIEYIDLSRYYDFNELEIE